MECLACYDARDRVTQQTYPAYDGSPARSGTDNYAVGGDLLTTSVTDPAGTITTVTDLLGRAISYTDVNGPHRHQLRPGRT